MFAILRAVHCGQTHEQHSSLLASTGLLLCMYREEQIRGESPMLANIDFSPTDPMNQLAHWVCLLATQVRNVALTAETICAKDTRHAKSTNGAEWCHEPLELSEHPL